MSQGVGSKYYEANGSGWPKIAPAGRQAEQIARELSPKAKRAGRRWMTCCPAHDDSRPGSFSVDENASGKLLVKCYVGCSQEAVIEALQRRGLWPSAASTSTSKKSPARKTPEPRQKTAPADGAYNPGRDISRLYDYHDGDGALVLQVVRTISGDPRFRQRRPDGRGGWIWSTKDIADRPLYRLPGLRASGDLRVWICEGEKDADTLHDEGVIATTNIGGAGKWQDSYSAEFRGKPAVILPDNDKPGRDHAETVARSLVGVAASIKVLALPGLADKQDVTDWLDAGHTVEELEQLADQAPEWRSIEDPPPEAFQSATDTWNIAMIPRRAWLAPPYLMRGEITLLHGPGGASKSLLQIDWAIACVLGRPFGRLEPRAPLRVILANFEDSADEQLRRLSAALDYFNATPDDLAGKLLRVSLGKSSDATMFRLNERWTLATTPAWDAMLWHCETFKPDVVFLDPLIAINAAGENDNATMRGIMTILRNGIAVGHNCALTLSHHDTKGSSEDTANDQHNARGAGDIVNAARFELAVKNMSAMQAEGFGLDREQRKHYFRVGSEDSKRNYAAPEAAEWFERTATLVNGESVVRCDPWTPPNGKLSEEQAMKLLAEIARGTSAGPYSPQLGKNDRSLSSILEAMGIAGDQQQRRALRDLKERHGVQSLGYKRPGHGSNIRQGLRTASGAPYNCQWCNGEDMEATK